MHSSLKRRLSMGSSLVAPLAAVAALLVLALCVLMVGGVGG